MLAVLTILVGITFLGSGAVKVLSVPQSLAIRDQLGISASLWRTIGALELAGVAGLVIGRHIPILGTLTLVGLALLMVGAIVSRLRVHDKVVMIAFDVVVLALVATTLALRV